MCSPASCGGDPVGLRWGRGAAPASVPLNAGSTCRPLLERAPEPHRRPLLAGALQPAPVQVPHRLLEPLGALGCGERQPMLPHVLALDQAGRTPLVALPYLTLGGDAPTVAVREGASRRPPWASSERMD